MNEINKTCWYNVNPELLEEEKAAMAKCFPGFELGKLDDGRLYWMGELAPGVYETKFGRKKSYTVMAVYQNNHPMQQMGSSVFVYPVLPNADELVRDLGSQLHFLMDSEGNHYFYPLKEDLIQLTESIKQGYEIKHSSVMALEQAYNWLALYETFLIDRNKLILFTPSFFL